MIPLMLQSFVVRLFFGVLCLIFGIHALALSTPGESYFDSWNHKNLIVNHWGINDGLPLNSVNHILQDENGYLWLSTFDGLARFDGVRFYVFNKQVEPKLTTNRIIKTYQTPDSTLWLETEPGHLISYKNNRFTRIDSEKGMTDIVNYIHQEKNGQLWFGTDNGIFTYNNRQIKHYRPDLINAAVDQIFVDKGGAVWYRHKTDQSFFRVGKQLTGPFFPENRIPVGLNVIHQTPDGAVWIANNQHLFRYKEGATTLRSSYLPPGEEILSLSNNHNGQLWVKSSKGAYFLSEDDSLINEYYTDERVFRNRFSFNEGKYLWTIFYNRIYRNNELIYEAESELTSFIIDREKNLWIGTLNRGLLQVRKNMLTTISTDEGLPNANVYPIIEGKDGSVWVGTFGNGLARIENGKVTGTSDFEMHRDFYYVVSLEVLSDGTIVTGVHSSGLHYAPQPGNRFLSMDTPEELTIATPFAIMEDNRQRLWVGSNAGLYIKEKNAWKRLNDIHSIPDAPVRTMIKAPDGSLWFGTNGGGILHYKNNSFKLYDTSNGLTSGLVRALHISDMEENGSYNLWVGYEDNGLDRFEVSEDILDPESVTEYRVSDGLFDYSIHRILEDSNGYFWMSTNRGIFRVKKNDLDDFKNGLISRYHVQAWTETNGMRNQEANGGMHPAGIAEQNGTIWFPTQDGVVLINPDRIASDHLYPNPVIEQIQFNNKIADVFNTQTHELPPGKRDFSVQFTILSLVNASENRFMTRLYPFDDWHDTGRRVATYTNIPPGTYLFQVRGAGNDGIWHPEIATVTIVVPPYFYETSWFKASVIIFVLLIMAIVIHLRTKKLMRSETKLKSLVEERTAELISEKEKTQKLADNLIKMDQDKDRFFANITHELKTPLTLILGPLRQIIRSGEASDNPEIRKKLKLMLRNAHRLDRLIHQLIDLTRLEHGELEGYFEKTDLNRFTRELCSLYKEVCREKNIELITELRNDSVFIAGDSDMLEKMIGNLLSNAIKFTEPGGEIRVQVIENNQGVFLSITDTGIGINEEDLEKIFDRFFQAGNGDKRYAEGTGIGLALVRELVDQHNGTISVNSSHGEGTHFLIQFPPFDPKYLTKHSSNLRQEVSVTQSLLEQDEIRPAKSDVNGSGKQSYAKRTHILLVEDNPDMQRYISETLPAKYRISIAGNGKDALEICKRDIPDLIIADIMMPEMDGITLNKKLKEHTAWASIPLIYLTAKAGDDNRIQALKQGADDYLVKPFSEEHLLARIQNLLDSRLRLRKQLVSESRLFLQQNRNEQPEQTDSFIMQVNAILEKHYTNPEFTVAELSDKCHLVRSQLYRKLKSKTGLTPQQYISRFRLLIAHRLLEEQAGTISEVAYGVGFSSLSWFSKCFSKEFGYLPSEILQDER